MTLLFLLMGSGPLGATTYYVDATGGNDGFAGTSTGSPWQTVGKVNSSSFLPGDQILFKRGETWYEALAIPSSGTAGQPITFGAYGSGDLPLFDGTYDGSITWQHVQGNIFRTISPAWPANPGVLLYKGVAKPEITTLRFASPVPAALQKGAVLLQLDGGYTNLWVTSKATNTVAGITFFSIKTTSNVYVRQLNASGREEQWPDPLGMPSIVTSLASLTEPGHWYYQSSESSVYLYSDVDPNSIDVRLGKLSSAGINCTGKDFVTIQDLAVQGFKDTGILLAAVQGVVVQNARVANIGASGGFKTGILIMNSQNNTIKNNRVESALRVGIGIYARNTQYYSQGNIVSGNTIVNPGATGISLSTDGQKIAYTVANNSITGNIILNANSLSYDSAGIYTLFVGGGNVIRSNTIKNGGSSQLRSSGIMIEGGNDSAIQPVTVDKNTIENNSLAGIAVSGKNHQITGNTLRKNGVVSWENAQLLFFASFGANASGCTVQSNVMEAGSNQILVSVLNGMGSGSPPHAMNNNTYCGTNPTPFCWGGWTCGTPIGFTTWKSVSGYDLNSSFTYGTCPGQSASGSSITGAYLLLLDQ